MGLLLIAAHVLVSQAEPLKHAYLLTGGVDVICNLYHHASKVERLPTCPVPSQPKP